MANTYLRPGVFVEETLNRLNDPATDSSDSIAAFVGTSSQGGPLGPTLVTSWSMYQSLFGNIKDTRTDDLGFGVYSFFNNGGSLAYIVRAVKTNATAASVTLNDGAGTPAPALKVSAKAPGTWASAASSNSRLSVTVTPRTGTRFDLSVEVGSSANLLAHEDFWDLSIDPADPRNVVAVVNSDTVGSKYVVLQALGTVTPAAASGVALSGGSDGTGSTDLFGAVKKLDDLDVNLMLNLPGVSDATVLSDVINWAKTAGNVFVVADGPRPGSTDTAATMATALTSLATGLPATSYVAVYGPYFYMSDPSSGVAGALRLTAPGGAVLGQYARTDITRGVQKAPAGTGTVVSGAINVAARFDDPTLDTLNQAGINVIRSVPGAGFCIMGARTLNPGMPDRYINIRRSLMFLKRDIVNVTRPAIFETNDQDTWDSISATLDQYLNNQFQAGLLSGGTPAEAYYIKCDAEINDAAAVNAGIVNVEVGVALNSPAEFIVIRIGQFDGGATATDTADDIAA